MEKKKGWCGEETQQTLVGVVVGRLEKKGGRWAVVRKKSDFLFSRRNRKIVTAHSTRTRPLILYGRLLV
jgi:hypothetical protein